MKPSAGALRAAKKIQRTWRIGEADIPDVAEIIHREISVAAEREACAKIAEILGDVEIAAAIRARSEEVRA